MGIQIGGMSGGGGGAGGDALTTNPLSQFAATTSAQLRGVISDETGSGLAVFNDSPTFITPILGAASANSISLSASAALTFTNNIGVAVSWVNTTDITFRATGSSGSAVFETNDVQLRGNKLGFGASLSAADIYLNRDAADTLAQRRTTSAQKSRLYNTFTTVLTVGEWWKTDWSTTANQLRFGTANGTSTGTARSSSWDYGGLEASPTAAITVPATSGSIVFGGGITLPDAGDVVVNTTTGTKIGTATSQKLGLWNVTPIIQPAGAGQAAITDATGGTPASSLVDVGVVFSQSAINANFATTAVLLLAMRTAMVNSGLMKGAA